MTYYSDNRERRLAYQAEYDRKNRDARNEYWRTHYKLPASKFRQKQSWCKQNGIAFDLTEDFFDTVPLCCPQCGKRFGPGRPNTPSLDRLNPSGGYVAGNVEWVCMQCNRRKSDLTYQQMLEFANRGLARNT